MRDSWRGRSLRTQTYFRLSLVSAENNVSVPEPGNDFCDVMTFVSLWPIRFHDRKKLKCSSQQIPRAVVLGLLELNCYWLKIPTSQNWFTGSASHTLFSAETIKRQPEIRLRSQARWVLEVCFPKHLSPLSCAVVQCDCVGILSASSFSY